MTSILLINNGGLIKSLKAKDITFETLYKKCGFKSAEEFDRRASWNTLIDGSDIITELWAKDDGKANTENKYDFPPPVDTALYFGTCALVRVDKKTGAIINLTEELWTKVYEKLFGGFEDIGDEDEFSEDELENVRKELKTKKGYLKDGFVIEDDDENDVDEYEDEDDDDDSVDEDDEDEEEGVSGSGTGGGSSKHLNPKPAIARLVDEEDNDLYDDGAGSELEEEEYEYSDEE